MDVPRLSIDRVEANTPLLNLVDLSREVPASPGRSAPRFEPDRWNARPEVANCYVYAANDFNPRYSDRYTGMDPGNFADFPADLDLSSNSGREMRRYANWLIEGAVRDGMQWTGNNATAAPGHYKIALFVAPGNPHSTREEHMDYHWVRQDADGTWSHKFGSQPVRNTDLAGRAITDPRRAAFGNYRFVGFFDVPQGGINLARETSPTFGERRPLPAQIPQRAPAALR